MGLCANASYWFTLHAPSVALCGGSCDFPHVTGEKTASGCFRNPVQLDSEKSVHLTITRYCHSAANLLLKEKEELGKTCVLLAFRPVISA